MEFSFSAVPTAQLHNETDLGFNIGASLSLLNEPNEGRYSRLSQTLPLVPYLV